MATSHNFHFFVALAPILLGIIVMIHRVGLLDFLQTRMEGAEHARRRYEVAAREDRGVDETPTRLRRRLAGRQSSTRSLKARSRQLITNSLFRPWRYPIVA